MDFMSVKKELTFEHRAGLRCWASFNSFIKAIFSIFYAALIFLWFVSLHQAKK
jgi:Fe2+ transport system protein B